MDNLIKYRNDRKSEGATLDELKPVDERIATLLKRSQMLWATETTVKVIDGTDSVMRSAEPFTVSVNLATETVGDLVQKACGVIGIGFMSVKLISGGRHHDPVTPLRGTWIREGSLVAICNRPSCDGTCPAATVCQPAFAQAKQTQPASTSLDAWTKLMATSPGTSSDPIARVVDHDLAAPLVWPVKWYTKPTVPALSPAVAM